MDGSAKEFIEILRREKEKSNMKKENILKVLKRLNFR